MADPTPTPLPMITVPRALLEMVQAYMADHCHDEEANPLEFGLIQCLREVNPPKQTVWIVYEEYNRGEDLEGACSLTGVYSTEAKAQAARQAAIEQYHGPQFNKRIFGVPSPSALLRAPDDEDDIEHEDGDEDEDTANEENWEIDIHVESREVDL